MAKKMLLLVFIHGFKGSDSTFADFPSHLAALLRNALPRISIETVVYPKYETRGDLASTVARFQEWLSNKVIDLEVQLGTTSPTVDPGVRVILVGHSMGGIVGAEALKAIVGDQPIPWHGAEHEEQPQDEQQKDQTDIADSTTLMFPYIQGLLAFDTPYLGLSPGVVAHGAEGHFNRGKALYETAAGLFATSAAATATSQAEKHKEQQKTLPSSETNEKSTVTNTSGSWQKWGKFAAVAGAASAVAAIGGTAAYLKRDQINEGFSWVGSHLQFVGCLARGEELTQRLSAIAELNKKRDVGFANLYTCLGSGAIHDTTMSSKALGQDRTFCVIPKSDLKRYFHKTINDKATDEANAHMWMFVPKSNPGFYEMGDHAKELISGWISRGWYENATPE